MELDRMTIKWDLGICGFDFCLETPRLRKPRATWMRYWIVVNLVPMVDCYRYNAEECGSILVSAKNIVELGVVLEPFPPPLLFK